jgi:hypothetical protein
MAMWIIAAGTLLGAAAAVLSTSRQRRDPVARHRSGTERDHNLVMSSEP